MGDINTIDFEDIKELYEAKLSILKISDRLRSNPAAMGKRIKRHIADGRLTDRGSIKPQRFYGQSKEHSSVLILTRHSRINPLTYARNKLGERVKEKINKLGYNQYWLDGVPTTIWKIFTAAKIKVQHAETSH